MNLLNIPVIAALTRRMDFLNQRQQVLAHNIANADTPNYRPKDMKAPSFRELLQADGSKFAMRASRQSHIDAAGNVSSQFNGTEKPQKGAATPAGNEVSLEQEMMKVAQNRLDHELTSNLYRKHLDMIRMALARR